MKWYLFCVAIKLAQDIEERDLWDYKLLLLILIEWSCWEVKGQKQEGGLRHLLLVFLCYKQCLFLLWWLLILKKQKKTCILSIKQNKLIVTVRFKVSEQYNLLSPVIPIPLDAAFHLEYFNIHFNFLTLSERN